MPISTRASLKPTYRKERKKWFPRGSWTEKTVNGDLVRKRDYYGAGSDTRAACQALCDRYNKELEDAITAGPKEMTFEEAALVYMQTGGDSRFLHDKLLDAIGQYRCDQIDDPVIAKAARDIYPNATPATLNRQLYTPVISVLRQASKGKPWKPDLTRPKGYSKLQPAKAPEDWWFDKVLDQCGPELEALVLFLTLHGRRPSDAFRRVPDDYDPKRGELLIDKDKSGNPVLVKLSVPVLNAMDKFDWRKGPGLFGKYTETNKRRCYKALHAACDAAKVPYFTLHKSGRHAFAKRLLREGKSLAHVKAAGRWATIRVVAELYGAFEHSEVDADTQRIADEWGKERGSRSAEVVNFPGSKKAG